jgi:hypothetical protein
MTLPALLLGFVLSTLLGAAFHLWKGGGAGHLLLDLALGWAGFWGGHYLGNLIGLTIGRVGPLQVGMATVMAIIFLLVGHFLSLEPGKKDGRG